MVKKINAVKFNKYLILYAIAPLQKNQRPVEKLIKYMIDVAMGMHYISERGLVHRVRKLKCRIQTSSTLLV